MKTYKPKRGYGVIELLIYLILGNALVWLLSSSIEGYLERKIIFLAIIIYNLICLYYIILDFSLVYILDKDKVIIKSFFGLKKIEIPFNEIEGVNIQSKNIKGFKLSGVGKHKYCLGRAVVDKVGIARMFVSNSSDVIYLYTSDISYGISPNNFNEFKEEIFSRGFKEKDFKVKKYNWKEIFKQKNVYIAFIIVSLLIIIIIINPFILYLLGKLPNEMPVTFDAHFIPVVFGTGKQFAFKQMMYGVLNMMLLICMYYAAYFSAKYDKKLACRYIYLSLLSALLFFIIQMQILITYL
ncbi:PH domain-containing protein [Clostridium tarantellae]|uniref:Bacterial Pleckstrin homology domain-containing protein n=1 Tax=Clostridium tarantellae TaxID=39493 RepID=A0A6I1MJ97_9CLOT|nr:PH domain-containing protein [Clostridium tarantellae]MPQ42227.1 hypothetical protein [Clostridium tarantellae]